MFCPPISERERKREYMYIRHTQTGMAVKASLRPGFSGLCWVGIIAAFTTYLYLAVSGKIAASFHKISFSLMTALVTFLLRLSSNILADHFMGFPFLNTPSVLDYVAVTYKLASLKIMREDRQ